MPVLHESTTPAEMAACRAGDPCAACRKRNGIALTPGVVHGYGTEPRNGWVPRRLGGDDVTAPTFGVELETQTLRGRDRLALTAQEAAAVGLPRGHWYPVSDGSVDGPEFTSQPATLAYWRSIAGPVGQFMRTLIHGGLRAHDGPLSCSMHVNIGADAFADSAHLARFLRLVTVNPRFTTRMAQRTHSQIASWARFDEYPDEAACVALAERYMRIGTAYTDHSAVVNLGNRGRVEFRAPRGTLRLDRFMGKLEWVAAMVEFTRVTTGRMSVGAFVAWVNGRQAEYPEFVRLMADLTPARVDPARASRTTRPATRTTSPAAPVGPVVCTLCGQERLQHGSATQRCPDMANPGEYVDGSIWTAPQSPTAMASMTDRTGYTWTVSDARAASTECPDGLAGVCERCGDSWGGHRGMLCERLARTGIHSVWYPDRTVVR